MARRRRSLIGGRRPTPTLTGADPHETEADDPPDQEPPEPDDPPETPADPAPEPEPEPEPELEPEPDPSAPATAGVDDEGLDTMDDEDEPIEEPPTDQGRREPVAPGPDESDVTLPGYRPLPGDPLANLDDDDFGLDAPPTEEVPSGLYEEVSPPYSAPMHVPEPPPIPGIVDRFTPPPVSRTPIGSRHNETRPSYMADTPTPPPLLARAKEYDANFDKEDDDDDDLPDRDDKGQPFLLLAVGGAGVMFVTLALALVFWTFTDGGSGEILVEAPEGPHRVKVRDNMTQKPGLIGVEEELEVEGDAPGEVEPEQAEPAEVAPPPAGPAPRRAPAQKAPRATPRPAPPPPAEAPPPTPEPVATKGTLKIRSNRRVLVYVNDKAIGYTPLDYHTNPGAYAVSAMVPGQPNTKQTVEKSIREAGQTAAVDFTF